MAWASEGVSSEPRGRLSNEPSGLGSPLSGLGHAEAA